MKLTTDALRALKTSFNLKFTEAMTAAHAEAVHPEFCMDVGDADFSIVEIPFLEQFAFMREWIGDRKVKNLSEKVLRITEKPWEDTVAIGQRDLETGAWKQKGAVIAALGAGGEQLWDTLFIEAITNPGNWIDGKAFFSADRKYGDRKGGTICNTTEAALSAETFGTAYQTMCSYTGSAGIPLRVKPTHLLVGPSQLDVAKEILESEKIRTAENTEVNNPHRGKVRLICSLDLVGANAGYWFLGACGGVIKPVLMQKSKTAELVMFNQPTDEMVFMSGNALFGATAYGNAAAAFPHLLYRGGTKAA